MITTSDALLTLAPLLAALAVVLVAFAVGHALDVRDWRKGR